jgi:predicted outer membrane repeat protein
LSGNSAQSHGGAIVGGSSSDLRMANSTCSDNTCGGNGGCFYTTGSLHRDNCTVTGNEAVFNGGALYTDFGATITLNTSLISENAAQQSGGGWFGFGSDKQALTVISTTFSNNTASCCYAAGYGSKLQSVDTSITGTTCSDTDTGKASRE